MEKFFRRPALVVGVIALVAVFFAFQLAGAELDNNNFRYIPDDNPAHIVSEYLDDTFGGQVSVLVGLERKFGTVFEAEFLARVRDFAARVEDFDYIKDVTSLMSTQYITGNADSIIAGDLVDPLFSGSPGEIAELKRRIASWDLLQGALVSESGAATQVLVTLNVDSDDAGKPEVVAVVAQIRNAAKEMFAGLAEVYVTGQPVISAAINESIIADMFFLIPMVVAVLLAVLFFSFRRWSSVFLVLLTVLVAVIWSIGAMPLFGVKLTIISMLLPVILMAVGSAYGIHVVTHYMEDTRDRILSAEEHRALVFALVRKMIKPVFLAALTTFAGFVSFCFTSIIPIREFGMFASWGVLVSFMVAVTLIPSLILIKGPPKKASIKRIKHNNKTAVKSKRDFNNTLAGGLLAVAERKKTILALTALVTALAFYGLTRLVVDNVMIEFFRGETDMSRSDGFMREYFGGSKELSMVVEADSAEILLSPEVLRAIDDFSVWMSANVSGVGKVVGFTDVIKRINQVFNVDESPDGLQVNITTDHTNFTNDDFGFGGFDDFNDVSFGDFGDDGFETPPPDTNTVGAAWSINEYTAADIIALLDMAAAQGGNGAGLARELKRLTNYEGFSYYEIPADPARYGKTSDEELQRLVSNYLVLVAGGDFSDYANDPMEPTAIRTMLQLRTTGDRDTKAVMATINDYIEAKFPKTVRVTVGGSASIESAITALIVNSQIISIAISILVVLIILTFSYRSFAAGVIGAIPLALAIICNFAVMGFLGIKLNIGTALIASISVGIGIDYTIHFIDAFKREYTQGGEYLRRTFIGSGKAILINAVSVGAGFGVLAFSRFKMLAEFGALIMLSMCISALVSLTVIPALLTTVKPKFIYKGSPDS
ncbi:MAG: MMPL family transporter [Treponema sp.]|jgi:predicted RND superfamily exporter protein|nr:MMPL family transporter [Treponema sp.]